MSTQTKKHRLGYLYKRGADGQQYSAGSKKKGVYYLQYDLNGKRFRASLKTSDREEAEAKRLKIMAPLTVADELEALDAVKQKLESTRTRLDDLEKQSCPLLTLSDSWQAYVDSPERPDSGDSTLQQYRFQYNRFEGWMREQCPSITALCDVTPQIASRYASTLNSGKYTANTYNKHIAFLKLFFRVLADKAHIEKNPWERIARKKQRPESRRELTIEELYKVLDTAKGELAVLLGIGTFTGMRLGDCATLRWSEVDLHRRIINRIPNKTARSKGKAVVIGIPQVLLERLKAIPKQERQEFILPETAEMYESRRYLLCNRIQSHFEACGITTHKKGTGPETHKRAVVEVGFHSLRHTYVSLHAEHGTPAAILQDNVGHTNPAMTRHYTHISELAATKYAGVLPAALGMGTSDGKNAPGQDDRLQSIRAAIDKLNARNWRQTKERLSAILESITV